ncbi:hypothetical protein [Robiginitalea sp. IMCC43444]|uniref:hypothetical protein n=1 Tax=Robiginitalea sp. IMCC43444 TaxID=3459121 RepID=UPI0040436352
MIQLLEFATLLADAAMFLLICCVQLIIYPSFLYYSKEQLQSWHYSYTFRISYLVVPLMISQLIGSLLRVFQLADLHNLIYCGGVLLTWLLTFSIFVPLHNKISKGEASPADLQKLVKWNTSRTFLWTFLFLWNLAYWFW